MVTPQDAIATLTDVFGRHTGYRALHAKGRFYTGTFTATPAAAKLTRAGHMQGEPVPTLVRLSHGAGHPRMPDGRPVPRGMAVRFTLPDGSDTVLSAQTARLFVTRSVEGFLAFTRAAQPSVASLWRFPMLVARHPEIVRTLRANSVALRIPASYATCAYHGLHAFRWVDAEGGSRFVRYHWAPAAGESFLSPWQARKRGGDFLAGELAERLASGPVRFRLDLQFAGPGDSTTDPSAPWRRTDTVAAGTLELTGPAPEDPEAGGGVVVYDPANVTDGIELPDDEILRFRSEVYSASVEQRLG
ncbi:MAG: catalase family peroxidase [Thermocrispum sp.]